MLDIMRTSGRTTRMIAAAKEADAKGRAVYVVFAYEGQRRHWQDALRDTRIKVETPASLGIDLDWDNLRTRRPHPNCVFFFDHYVMLQRIGPVDHLFREMHRWDNTWPDSERFMMEAVRTVPAMHDWDTGQARAFLTDYYVARKASEAKDDRHVDQQPGIDALINKAHRVMEAEKRKRGVHYPSGWIANTEADAEFIKGQEALIEALEYRP